MRSGIVHHKSDRKSCVILTADRNRYMYHRSEFCIDYNNYYYYRYGWVIVAVAFFIYTLSMITMANFGIFLVELVEQYQAPNAVIGWIGALQLACHGLVGK